jgi:hypothetical protein
MNGYAITIAWIEGANRVKVVQLDYAQGEENLARAAYRAACANPNAISATLEGPGGIILAEYEAAQTALEV